jgi:hypothetical protein
MNCDDFFLAIVEDMLPIAIACGSQVLNACLTQASLEQTK